MPSRYEDELWRELVDKHGEGPEGEHPPAPPWRPRGPWAAAGGAVLVAAAATGGVLAYSAISAPTPAYAVTRNHDGSVRIYLGRTSAIKGLNARLKQMNVQAQAVLVAGGCPAPAALAAASLHARGGVSWTVRGQAVVRPAKTPARIHILLVRRGAHGNVSLSDVVSKAHPGFQVPSCVNHVRVATGPNGAFWTTVRPMALAGAPGPCAPPPTNTTGATTTTGDTTTTGETATTGGTTTAAATATTGATTTTSGQTTGTTTSAAPPVVVRCCRFIARGGGGGGNTTSGATTPTTDTTGTTGTTPTTGTTGTTSAPPTRTLTWTTTNGTVTTTTVPRFQQVPAGTARCQMLHPRMTKVVAPAAALSTATAQTSTTAAAASPTTGAKRKSKKH
ncbi:MAG TPA: hypothetical protein VMF07_14945 [Solirubrobacteraceae bacterium]|nr:hypothetical protein [Solirubrobacteraceae bacterium]